MRENSSMCVKMIDGNWVLKRKRKRLASGLDLSIRKEGLSQSLESPRKNLAKQKLKGKGDFNTSQSECKKKGNDGYYYECVICDLGGNLLCCDSCPRTYHLQCLDPPLKRTPPGKWQCPNCCEQKASIKPVNHLDTVSRRARTKINVDKLKPGIKPSVSDKLSLFFQSSIPGKNRSSSKGKPAFPRTVPPIGKKSESSQVDVSCSNKSSPPTNGVSIEGFLTCSNIDDKEKIILPNKDGSLNKKSSHQELPTYDEALETNLDDEPSVMVPEFYCNNGTLGTKHAQPSGHAAKRDTKRKLKVKGDNRKSRKDQGKCILITSKCESKAAIPVGLQITRPHKKRSSVNKQISKSVSKVDCREGAVVTQGKNESFPKGLRSLHGLVEQGAKIDKTTACGENVLDEVQQVDRILGCRAQSINAISLPQCQSIEVAASPESTEPGSQSVRLARDSSSHNQIVSGSHDGILDEHPAGSRALNMKDDENLQAVVPHNTTDQADGIKNPGSGIGVDKIDVQKSFTDLNSSRIEIPEECALGSGAIGDLTRKVEPEERADASLHDAILGTRPNCIAENKIEDAASKESTPTDQENVCYEFLVKWVGKSHIHNSWVPESQLKILAKRKLENYKAKYGTALINLCKEQWKQPQRVMALRTSKFGSNEALIKWRDLSYDECTWERLDEPIIENSEHLFTEFNKLQCQTFDMDAAGDYVPRTKGGQQGEVVPLVEQPEDLKGGSLFPHQLEALNWLRKCWYKSKNVILADEMGLGKTVSACAFISSLYFEFKARLPCLVLVPLSTMPNWLAEFALWAPHLNVVEYHGSAKARSVIRQYEWHASNPIEPSKKTTSYRFNVLLTTYEMVLADASHLRGVPWEVLVVDEGHRLKNSGSKLFSLLNTFSFQHRVLLTGTPLQNNIGEMYNLLNFLQPDLFPSLSSFEEKFNDLTTAARVEELKKLVAPHMLRRLKKDAMQNIPPKIERMVPVELSSIQAEYYRAMLTKNYQILRNIGKGVAQQSMLNIVMQLRKVCNHPYLIPGTEPESGSMEFLQEMRIKASAKLTLLHSMLKILKKEGHRVLIFSQMTKLLDILEDYLTVEFGPKVFERVDGSVSVADRQSAIARFNQDKSRFIFLLSTRSCGLGINLATADTVIIYDSDFNPHADIQAMNRAHRIGQSNRLLVYRLVVRASVEERILQLAKKKLMLDQLFVNKSECQKDVEDILRWGTEELFRDSGVSGKDTNENSSNRTEVTAETEQRHRRRGGGGLGDVYEDRPTDGSTKIVWDENAILRLLDRSNLQLGPAESTEGDLENDMLGSVKSVEWNDEPTEEQGGTELLPSTISDVCAQSSEKKEDHIIGSIEENEWDRLLRVRWEKYQSEVEATLGRGKRLRKAVSYKEAFVPIPSEALSETCNEEEPDPAPEPEYTPAGRALKAKYAKLRARQKERLAQRHTVEGPHLTEYRVRPELLPEFSVISSGEEESLHIIKSAETRDDKSAAVNLEESKIKQPSDVPKSSGSVVRLSRFSKHGYKNFQSSNLDFCVRPPASLTPSMFLPSPQCQFQSRCYGNSASTGNNLLPVLGLRALNSNQEDSEARNLSCYLNLPRSSCGQGRAGGQELPLRLNPSAPTLTDEDFKSHETAADTSVLPDASTGGLHCQLKNTIPDSGFPLSPFLPNIPQGLGLNSLDSSSDTFSAFQEKLALRKLVLDDKLPPSFSLPSKNMSTSHPDLLPSLSLGIRTGEATNLSIGDLPETPLLSNFRLQMNDNASQNLQAREVPPSPVLGLSMQASSSSLLPEKHKKVLESIMMRTGSRTNHLLRKKIKIDMWSEDELDALWIGVRRHGRGNWEAMLRDPKLKFLKYRMTGDLSEKWEEEQLKILDGPVFQSRQPKSSLFPAISDGMMTRALFASRLAGLGSEQCALPKFQSHLTDIKLGYGDITSSLPHVDLTDHFSLQNDRMSTAPASKSDKFVPSFARDFPVGSSDTVGDLNVSLEQQLLPNSLSDSSMDPQILSRLRSCDLPKMDEECANKYLKLPSLLDKSLSWLRDSHSNSCGGESSSGFLPIPNRRPNTSDYPMKDDIHGSSKLPHWLREAVNVPAKPPEPFLPPTVKAIARSVRLLYGEEKSTIPPFTIPGPPPSQPKDPRRILKKKKKLRKMRQSTSDTVASSRRFQSSLPGDRLSLGSMPPVPPFPLLLPSTTSALSFPRIEPNLSLSSPSQNMMNSPSSSSYLNPHKKGMMMSPSPEVLHLVASCVAPGPQISPGLTMPSSSFLQTEFPVTKSYEPSESIGMGGIPDLKGLRRKRKARRGLLLGGWGVLPEERIDRADSENCSKTQSEPSFTDRPEIAAISSEETVSDDHGGEH